MRSLSFIQDVYLLQLVPVPTPAEPCGTYADFGGFNAAAKSK